MSAAQVTPSPWFRKWPKLGSPSEFAVLRRVLDDSGYTVEGLCRRLNVERIENFSVPPEGGRTIQDTLDAILALFYDCGFVERSVLTAALPPGVIEVLDSLDLLDEAPGRPDTLFATAAILPAFGVLTACDRAGAPDRASCDFPVDVVYPPVFDTTHRFVIELPVSPCDAMLDLGTGTGIAAMLGAPHARHVWATDITARAARYAEFNCRLAGLDNVTVLQGDLYQPVEGMTFDRIVIHPPYVPDSFKRRKFIFADAGEDGEQIVRGTIEGLPRFLRPGGRFYSLQSATDREGELFEDRIRKWLGPHEGEFDIALAVHALRTPLEFLASGEVRAQMSLEASRSWLELWERTKTTRMVYSAVLIERHKETRGCVTKRTRIGKGYSGRNLESQLEWQKAITQPDYMEMLMNCRPVVPPENEIVAISRLRDGEYRTEEFRVEVAGPFLTSLQCERWLTKVLPLCQGDKTWAEHFEYAKQADLIRSDIPPENFAMLLGILVSGGVLQVPGFLNAD